MTDNKLFLFGYSGHALVVADCARHEYNLEGYFDQKENLDNPLEINYHGDENDVDSVKIINNGVAFPSIGSNKIRKQLIEYFRKNNLKEITIKHPSAVVSKKSSIGKSSLIGPNATVNANAVIEDGVIVNSRAVIEHDCIVKAFSHIAPGSILAGNVHVDELSFIGAGAVIKEGVRIGSNVIIGAGSVVLNDIPDNEKWVGNPARKIGENL